MLSPFLLYQNLLSIKITLFYSENSRNFQISETKESPALLSQGRVKFSGKGRENSLPPQQREFETFYSAPQLKRLPCFSIVLPNLIHQSKKWLSKS